MKFTVEYNPDFFDDLTQAVDWYNKSEDGLGNEFFKSVGKQTTKLSITALQFAVRYKNVRCMQIIKFPYLVHYRVNKQTKTVRVEALFHTSRDPKVWNKLDMKILNIEQI
jgi:hypothetical protein